MDCSGLHLAEDFLNGAPLRVVAWWITSSSATVALEILAQSRRPNHRALSLAPRVSDPERYAWWIRRDASAPDR